jgi:membrane protease YdiL (CAAX protease family)
MWMLAYSVDNSAPAVLMMFTPGLSAVVTSWLCGERVSIYGWRFGKYRFLAFGYLLPIFVAILAYGLVWLSGLAEFTTDLYGYLRYARWLGLAEPVSFATSTFLRLTLGFSFTSIFCFGEELGWSGFLIPRLRRVTSVHATSLVVGLFFAAWHAPAIVAGVYGYGAPLWISLPGFALVCVGSTYFKTILVSEAKSLWLGVVLHASHNMFAMGSFYTLTVHQGYANYLVSETGIVLGLVYLSSALLLTRAGRQRQSEQNRSHLSRHRDPKDDPKRKLTSPV